MVTTVTSFGRSGLYDWMVQRASAVVLAAYTFFIAGFILMTPEVTYEQWSGLFDALWVRVFSLGALVSLGVHAWIGLWAVLTDYLTERMMGDRALTIRITMQIILSVINVAYIVWGIEIIWGM